MIFDAAFQRALIGAEPPGPKRCGHTSNAGKLWQGSATH